MVKKIDPDATYATALWRGGRLTKWKGQAASLSPSLGQLIASVSVFALGRALTVGASKTATAALLGGVGLILTTSGVSAACDESPLGSGVHSCSGEINGTVALISAGDQLTITSSATITGDTDGINARNNGSGALRITTTGATTGTVDDGIEAWSDTSGTDLTIDAGTTSGGDDGIYAVSYGSGALNIITTGTTTGGTTNYDQGITAWNYGSDLTINASTTTGGRDGINARNYGTGALSITTSGAITGGTGYGINAKSTAGKTVNITLDSGSAVSSTAGLGIFNDGGNSTTTFKAGASVAGKIVLGAGDDNLVLAGGDLSAVCNLDRPRRPRKTNR